jgi:hypothetical protein
MPILISWNSKGDPGNPGGPVSPLGFPNGGIYRSLIMKLSVQGSIYFPIRYKK